MSLHKKELIIYITIIAKKNKIGKIETRYPTHNTPLTSNQGAWKAFLTIKGNYYVHRMFAKSCAFVNACNIYEQKYKISKE